MMYSVLFFFQGENWHLKYKLPDLSIFGHSVIEATKTGIITSAVRRRVTQVLKSSILIYTANPTPVQYNTVCKALISAHPKLMDKMADGDGVVCIE